MAPALHSSSPTVVSLLATRQNGVANKKGGKRRKSPALSSGMSQREINISIEHMPFIPLGQHHTAKYCKRAGRLREGKQTILSGQLRYFPNRKVVPTWKVLWIFSSLNHLNKIIFCSSSIQDNAFSALACLSFPGHSQTQTV